MRGAPAAVLCLVIAGSSGVVLWWTVADADPFWIARVTLARLLSGLLFAGVAALALRGASMLDRDTQQLREHAAHSVVADARLTERSRLDALIHDTVLSALLAGGWAAEPEAVRRSAELASLTLERMAGPDPDAGHIDGAELAARLRQVCAQTTEDVRFTVSGLTPDIRVEVTVARILQEITGEALRNSARHAAVPGRHVLRWAEVVFDASAISVAVGTTARGSTRRRSRHSGWASRWECARGSARSPVASSSFAQHLGRGRWCA